MRPAVKRVLVREVRVCYRVAERRACRVLGFARSSFRYKSRRDQRAELRVRLRDLAASRVHYGYQRLWVLLRREGWIVNKKLVYRLYREEGLGIRRRKPRRRKSVQVREARPPTGQTNESWSMDFMADQLVGGQRFRLLTLVDNHSRESLAIEVGQRLTGDDVVRVLEQVTSQRGKPQSIRVDNGPEFVSQSLDLWAYFNGVKHCCPVISRTISTGCDRRPARTRRFRPEGPVKAAFSRTTRCSEPGEFRKGFAGPRVPCSRSPRARTR